MIKIDISSLEISANEFAERLKSKGLLVKTNETNHLRLVLHKDINRKQVNQAAHIINSLCEELS